MLSTSPDSSRAAAAYYLSGLYDDLNRPDLALRYARLALWRNRESPSNNDFKQLIFSNAHLGQDRLDSAVYYYQQALADSRRRHDRQDEASSLGSLAGAFLRAGTPQQARP